MGFYLHLHLHSPRNPGGLHKEGGLGSGQGAAATPPTPLEALASSPSGSGRTERKGGGGRADPRAESDPQRSGSPCRVAALLPAAVGALLVPMKRGIHGGQSVCVCPLPARGVPGDACGLYYFFLSSSWSLTQTHVGNKNNNNKITKK